MPRARPTADAPEAATGSSQAERCLRLLAVLAQEGRALSLAELGVRLGLPKATTHRLCTQLIEGGFLARDTDEKSFAVGPALRRLAFDTLNHGVVRGLRHEVLAALVMQIGETCNFTTLDGTEVLYNDRVEAQWPLRLTLDPDQKSEKILLDIPEWSFDWQMNYGLAEPLQVKAGQEVLMECSWDRRVDPGRAAKYIVFAEGTEDEMCFGTYGLVVDP